MQQHDKNVFSSDSICYKDEEHRRFTVFQLLLTSVRYFKKALRISDYDSFVKAINASLEEGFDERMRFADEALIDAVKFGICFENYFKAKTLEGGYLIHHIVESKDLALKSLCKAQRRGPVKISDFLQFDAFSFDPVSNCQRLTKLTDQTLKISSFWKDSYWKVTASPARIAELAKDYSRKRNTLHFLLHHGDAYSPKQLQSDLRYMIDFVNNSMVDVINSMIASYGYKKGLQQQRINQTG